ncbi:MAG TPA: secretin N-terminal domain-containing protein [Gemmatimonadaceae bacterium]|nr:secretin N-terminal domain-containing protein [Gemmatimonadaceae bacterium]
MRANSCTVALMAVAIAIAMPLTARAQRDSSLAVHGDSVRVRLIDVDVRAAIQSLAPYLDRPVIFAGISGTHVTLETPGPVPRGDVIRLLRGVLESQGMDLLADSGIYRVAMRPPPVVADATATPKQARADGAVQLFVIRLRHARAADVAATVNALYGRSSAVGEIGAKPQLLDEQLRQNLIPSGQVSAPAAVAAVVGRVAALSGDITIVPDPRSNSLLIRASQNDFDLIQAAVEILDIRPLQVLIEVMIAEVRRDRSFSFGVDASTKTTGIKGTQNATGNASQSSGGLTGDFIAQIMNLGPAGFSATLTAAAARGDVKILSRPIIIAANNEQAQILVGSQRPFVQVSRSLPTDAATRDEVVQYKDVGTRLVVRPTISPDGYVVLEVTQEVNNATNEVAFNAPVISTRSVQTQLLIKDGQTVALGGLRDRQRDSNQGGIPFLSSIPLIGGLFGHTSRQTSETELFLFLTPRVIRTDADADSLTKPLLNRAKENNQ